MTTSAWRDEFRLVQGSVHPERSFAQEGYEPIVAEGFAAGSNGGRRDRSSPVRQARAQERARARAPRRTIVCDAGALVDPDIGTIEELAALQLVAARLGCRVRLHNVPPRLRELVELAGLTSVLAVADGSAFEPGRELEQREQSLGVQEEADPRDPSP
jgi:hypothetical protein